MSNNEYEKKYSDWNDEKLKNMFGFLNRNISGFSKSEMRFGEPEQTMDWIKQLNAISDELDKRGEWEWIESQSSYSPNNPVYKESELAIKGLQERLTPAGGMKSNPKKYKDIGEEMYHKYGYGAIEDKPELIEAYIRESGEKPERGYAQKGQLYDLMTDQSFGEELLIMEKIGAISKSEREKGVATLLRSYVDSAEKSFKESDLGSARVEIDNAIRLWNDPSLIDTEKYLALDSRMTDISNDIYWELKRKQEELKSLGRMIVPMSVKEVGEARRVGISDQIIGKMAQGLELSEREKKIVRDHGKVYVRAFKKHESRTIIKPQIRDLPKYRGR